MTDRTGKDALKKDIKKHFTTYSAFARLAGLDYYSFSREFLNNPYPDKEYIETIRALLVRLKDSDSNGAISASELRSLKKAINERGGVITFCRENEEFSEGSVFKILAGDDSYRKAARRLMDYLKL